MSLEVQLRDFIATNFILNQNNNSLQNNDSLLDNGVIDSTGVLELVTYLEERHGVVVEDDEMSPDNLDSIDKLAAFVRRKQ